MRPKYNGEMLSAILHGTLEAVLGGPQKEEDREELKGRFRLLLGSLLMEAPNPGTLLQLLSDRRGYALGETGEAQTLTASSISLLLAMARKFPQLRMTVIQPDLACFWRKPKEDDIIIEDTYSVQTSGSAGHQREATGRQLFSRSWPASGQIQKKVSPTPWGQRTPLSLVCFMVCTQDSPLRSSCWESCRTCSLPGIWKRISTERN
ncbi:uncharacterized protein LOC128413487 [Podarcis raffonei]|uniref:uncharacterized protein LOC128413487 n=1 Tax=Podarcis raffonei TaxID=65483 RepID=UPI0023291F64|nr:uncharacterized protein LOC128413487 [Podarcis raffonei]